MKLRKTAFQSMKMWILLLIGSTFSSIAWGRNELLFDRIELPYEAYVVNCLYQDNQGMIWMGTKRGLFSYNGYGVHRVIEGNIHVLTGCVNECLCFADDNGLHWLDLRTEKIVKPYEGVNIRGDVRALLIHDEKLYIGTRSEGIFLMDLRDGTVSHFDLFEEKESLVFEMVACGDDIFIGHYKGLVKLTPDDRLLDCGIDDQVYALLYDDTDSTLWLGTEHRLLRHDPKSGETKEVMAGGTINGIEISAAGDLLLASEYGLRIYNKETGTVKDIGHDVTDVRHSLPNNNVHDILRDRQQNIWVATDRGVVITPTSNQFRIIELSELFKTNVGNYFNNILIDSRGDRWLAGDNGLVMLSEDGNRWFRTDSGLRKNVVRSIYEDRDNELWIASDAGIARFNRSDNSFTYFTLRDKKGRNANWAYDLYEDIHGRLWVATYMGGLYLVDKKALLQSGGEFLMETTPFAPYEEIVSTTTQICPASDSLLWLNTDKGLASVNIETLEVSLKKDINLERIRVIDGTVWMDENGKLYRYDEDSQKRLPSGMELQNGMIYGFLKENNRVWLTTSHGLYYADKSLSSLQSYGMPPHPFMTGAYDKKRGEIIWAGEDFIGIQSLASPLTDFVAPEVYVSSLLEHGDRLNDSVPRYVKDLKLTSQEDIRLELTTFNYNPLRPESFWYRLGKDGEWHILPYGSNQITFAHLSGGNYSLFLSCTDPKATDHFTQYTLHVPYPWYLRWWAWVIYVIIAVVFIGTLWWYLKYRERILYERREREQMLAMTQQKMDFFVNMSHELKTPLSLIIAPLSKLLSETTNARTKERLKNIHSNALRLNELIYRILDMKRMEAEGEDTLLISHVELCELLQRCIKEFDEVASSKGIEIELTYDKEALWMNLDAMKIQTSVRNLLSNAIKYAPSNGGLVKIHLEIHPSSVVITVHDNGNGVEKEELPKLFNRYFQGKNAKEESSGIGLSLVKKYVEMHGGNVRAENDKGLKVSLELPLSGNDVVDEVAEERPDEEKPRILLVDDNQEILDFLTSALSSHYTCITALNGDEALKIIAEKVPDLIITDQMMPGMDGTELCKRIRHDFATSVVPIIMLTAKDDSETELQSIRIGVDIFMPKPFDLRKLQLHVVQLLSKRKAISQSVNISKITKRAEEEETNPLTSDEALMDAIMHIVEDNLMNEDFNVTKLSEMLKMDQKQVYRKLKQLTGLTPVAFIRQKRMQKAASLLVRHRFTVSEVMYRVGFTSPSYFSKCFMNEFGVLPSEYGESGGE